jgi:hypothetical protein
MGSFFLSQAQNIVIKGVVTSSEDGCSSWSISTSSGTNIERLQILTVSSINNVDKMRLIFSYTGYTQTIINLMDKLL